ncbi:hypothetical protein LTR37_013484 [Vermiconidia calcicola]|uniref:Uncharacterized protein n=1 Tax=Vermiconidia calcicola TaxID=1690605 RepID=A0ACC3MWF7_9PEZI|nr:hypothetical protein LTR37_013484 [Vermiconidia calcicola]
MDRRGQQDNGQRLYRFIDFSTETIHLRQHGHGPGPFRFLDLPAELRLKIYDFYFTTSSCLEPDLLQFRSHMPSPRLTTVCCQIHAETQEIYEKAKMVFARDTVFSLNNSPERKVLMYAVRAVPRALHVRKVSFKLMGESHYIDHIRVEARMLSDGSVDWTLMFAPNHLYDTDILASAQWHLLRQLQNKVSNYQSPSAGLDVARCLEAVYDAF